MSVLKEDLPCLVPYEASNQLNGISIWLDFLQVSELIITFDLSYYPRVL